MGTNAPEEVTAWAVVVCAGGVLVALVAGHLVAVRQQEHAARTLLCDMARANSTVAWRVKADGCCEIAPADAAGVAACPGGALHLVGAGPLLLPLAWTSNNTAVLADTRRCCAGCPDTVYAARGDTDGQLRCADVVLPANATVCADDLCRATISPPAPVLCHVLFAALSCATGPAVHK